MAKEMLINVSEGEECRIALLDDGKLEELYMERHSSTSHVGNIYKGRVTNVEASIQAAFIDFGLGRNGFLHISDLMPTYFGHQGQDMHETVGRKISRRDRPPIQRCLRRGDEIIVQIIKEGIGTKGPTLTTYLSIPGRILVMMPGMGKMGVSKKIEDDEERRRLRQILDGLKPPKDVGFIIRTAGIGRSKTEIERDLKYLTRLWENIEKKRKGTTGPTELYTEGDLITRTVRDVFSSEVDRIVVDSKDVAKRIKEFIKITAPRTKNKVEVYEELLPLFSRHGIEKEIEKMYSRHVPLPSGGSLVIDSTEAVVAIDVNSGKFREHNDAELTAFKTDMEAADEIPRQLKLRDLGGVIICDFIDLRFERHRRELETRLHENLKRDRAKTKVLRMSQFGIIEMTRQRMRPSLKRSIYFDCPHCKGAGLVKTPESMALDVMRRLAMAVSDLKVVRVELTVCVDVAFYLQNKKRAQLAMLEDGSKKRIIIRSESNMGLDEMKLELFDSRDGTVLIEGLNLVSTAQPQFGGRGRSRSSRPDDRRGGPPGQRRLPAPAGRSGNDEDEDRFDLDSAEEAVDDREERMESGAADVDATLAASVDASAPADSEPAAEAVAPDATVPDEAAPEAKAAPARAPRGRGKGTRRDSSRRTAPAPVAEAEPQADEDLEDIEGVDDPTAGGSELLSRDNAAVGEENDRYGRGNRQRRGGRGGRGGGRSGQERGPANDQDRPRNASQGGERLQNRNDRQSDDRSSGDRQGANRQGADRQGADRQGTDRQGGDRSSGARPNGARQGADRQGGDRQGSDRQGGDRGQSQQSNRGQQNRNNQGQGRDQNRGQQPQNRGQQNRNQAQNRQGGRRGPQPNQQNRNQPRLSGDDAYRNIDEEHEPDGNVIVPDAPLPPDVEGNAGPVGSNSEQGGEGEGENGGQRRRRRRGGRRHRRRRENAEARLRDGSPGDSTGPANDSDDASPADGEGAERIEADDVTEAEVVKTPSDESRRPKQIVAEEPIVRTGSTDRHYVATETPVDPEPVRRPRSYRDLDAIPDDLD